MWAIYSELPVTYFNNNFLFEIKSLTTGQAFNLTNINKFSFIFVNISKLAIFYDRNIFIPPVYNQTSPLTDQNVFFSPSVADALDLQNQAHGQVAVNLTTMSSNTTLPLIDSVKLNYSGILLKSQYYKNNAAYTTNSFFNNFYGINIKNYIVLDISLFSFFSQVLTLSQDASTLIYYLIYLDLSNIKLDINTMMQTIASDQLELNNAINSAHLLARNVDNIAKLAFTFAQYDVMTFQALILLISLPLFFFLFYFSFNIVNFKRNPKAKEVGILKVRGLSQGQINNWTVTEGFLDGVLAYFFTIIFNNLIMLSFNISSTILPLTTYLTLFIIAVVLGIFFEYRVNRALIHLEPLVLLKSRLTNLDEIIDTMSSDESIAIHQRWSWVQTRLAFILLIACILSFFSPFTLDILASSGFSVISNSVAVLSLIGKIIFPLSPILLAWAIAILVESSEALTTKITKIFFRPIFHDATEVFAKAGKLHRSYIRRILFFSIILVALTVFPIGLGKSLVVWNQAQPGYQLAGDIALEGPASVMFSKNFTQILEGLLPSHAIIVKAIRNAILLPTFDFMTLSYLTAVDLPSYIQLLKNFHGDSSNLVSKLLSQLQELTLDPTNALLLDSSLFSDSVLNQSLQLNFVGTNYSVNIHIRDKAIYFPGLESLYSTNGGSTSSLLSSVIMSLQGLNNSVGTSNILNSTNNFIERIIIGNLSSTEVNVIGTAIIANVPDNVQVLLKDQLVSQNQKTSSFIFSNTIYEFAFFELIFGLALLTLNNAFLLSAIYRQRKRTYDLYLVRGMKTSAQSLLIVVEFFVFLILGLTIGVIVGVLDSIFTIQWIFPLFSASIIPIPMVFDTTIVWVYLSIIIIDIVFLLIFIGSRIKSTMSTATLRGDV